MAPCEGKRKIRFARFGLAEDPHGLDVTLRHDSRELLGRVVRAYRREAPPAIMLEVQYFNGEPWPIDPAAGAVEVLDRNWKA